MACWTCGAASTGAAAHSRRREIARPRTHPLELQLGVHGNKADDEAVEGEAEVLARRVFIEGTLGHCSKDEGRRASQRRRQAGSAPHAYPAALQLPQHAVPDCVEAVLRLGHLAPAVRAAITRGVGSGTAGNGAGCSRRGAARAATPRGDALAPRSEAFACRGAGRPETSASRHGAGIPPARA